MHGGPCIIDCSLPSFRDRRYNYSIDLLIYSQRQKLSAIIYKIFIPLLGSISRTKVFCGKANIIPNRNPLNQTF